MQKLDRHPESGDEVFPLVAHAEGGMCDRTEIPCVGLWRDDLVADVEQRVHETAVGVVDEDEGWFFHCGLAASPGLARCSARDDWEKTTPTPSALNGALTSADHGYRTLRRHHAASS